MTDVRDDRDMPMDDASAAAREEAQRRIREIMTQNASEDETAAKSKRTRNILATILILLMLVLCGVGVYLYKLLAPGSGANADELAGITWIRSIYGYGPRDDQQFVNPNDVATGPDGTVWIADPGTYQVAAFRADGTYVDRITADRNTGEPFRVASRIAVDGDGIMYIVDRPNATLTIMDGKRRLAQAQIPGATTVDVNDEMVVVGSNAGFAILDKDGNVKTIVGSRGNNEDQFDIVGGVTIDSAKASIYVVDTFNNRLSAWDYSGKRKWIVKLGNPGNEVKLEGGKNLETTTTAPAALQLPTDVTIDGKGRPVVLDAFDFTLSIFDPADGSFIEKWGTFGDQDGQFMYPTGVNYDATKDWFLVADTDNQRAQIIRIAGTGAEGPLGIVSGFNRLMAGPLRALWPLLGLIPALIIVLLVRRWMRKRAEQADEQGVPAGEGVPEPLT